jgi:hypothetical protein
MRSRKMFRTRRLRNRTFAVGRRFFHRFAGRSLYRGWKLATRQSKVPNTLRFLLSSQHEARCQLCRHNPRRGRIFAHGPG